MFIGHYGIALGLKKADNSIPLWVLFIAVQIVDIAWTILVMFGVERVIVEPGITAASPFNFVYYPFTHSFLATVVWGLAVYLIAFRLPNIGKSKVWAATILALAVTSHFVLDVLTHRPDLSLAGSQTPMLGLGLWNYPVLSYLVEVAIFAAGLYLYYRATKGEGFGGRYGMLIFGVVLILFNGINLFGPPPPPDTTILAAAGLLNFIIITLAAFWLDRKRSSN